MPIPVLVIGGYLGAGKTTLVNAILRETRAPVGVIVNDFGAIGLDADLVANRSGDTVELANGCACCTLAGGMHAALAALGRRTLVPALILIEASGVAQPRKVAQYAKAPGFTLDGVVVLVDAQSVRTRAQDRLVGRDVCAQIASADLLLLNKTDLVDAAARTEIAAWLGTLNAQAPVIYTNRARVPLRVLTGAIAAERSMGEHVYADDDDAHGERYVTWSFESALPLERAALDAFLAELPPATLRGKGIVRFADAVESRYVLHLVGRRSTLRDEGAWKAADHVSRIVLLAAGDRSFVEACDALALRSFA